MKLKNKLSILILLLGAPESYAACTSPAAAEGAREYVSGTFKLCDGTNWIDFSTDGTAGACTGAGKMDYDDALGAYKFCDNSNWHKIKKGPTCSPTSLTYASKVTSGTYLAAVTSVRLSADGTRAYVVGQWNSRLSVYDVSSSPSAPTFMGSVSHANLNDSVDMQVFGDYAFVIARNTDNLAVVDVSNPSSPTYVTRVQSSPTNQMANVWGLGLSEDGNYAYAVSWNSGASSNKCFFNVFDISTPTSPTYTGAINLTDGGTGGYVYCNKVLVKGNYAFVSFGDGALVVVDVSSPSSPSYVAKVTPATASQLESMDFSDDKNYIFATTTSNNHFNVFDVSSPAAPTHVTNLTDATYWGTAYGVKTVGSYVLTGGSSSDTLGLVDVSNPSSPTKVTAYTSSTNIDGASDVAIHDRYVYVAGNANDTLAVIDMGCSPASLDAGSCSTAKQIEYFSPIKSLAWCDGSKWRIMAQ